MHYFTGVGKTEKMPGIEDLAKSSWWAGNDQIGMQIDDPLDFEITEAFLDPLNVFQDIKNSIRGDFTNTRRYQQTVEQNKIFTFWA